MRTALVAIDPMALKEKVFEGLCEKIRSFQELGFISKTSIASISHRDQYLMPYEYYKTHKDELAKEARLNVERACEGKFQYKTVRVIQSDASANEELVALLSRHGKRMNLDLLVIGTNDRKGLPYWFLGSLAETASLSATMPVLVLKHSAPSTEGSRTRKLVVSVDASASPSTQDITWLANLSRSTKSHLSLVYIEPRKRAVVDSLQQRKGKAEARQSLQRLATSLRSRGAVTTTVTVLPEDRSIAHTIVEFAEKQKAWMTITTTAKRTRMRKLLLGSNARHILALSKGPFLSLRLE